MIYFLHGDNQVNSRQKLTDLVDLAKQDKKEVVKLNGLNLKLTDVLQNLETSSLFGQDKFIIIENLFSRPKSDEKDKIIKYLKKEKITPGLIFWEKKEISGTTLRWLPKTWQYQLFKTPVIIFKFLDALRPNNTSQVLSLMHDCLKNQETEMVFYMLARQTRLLIIAKDAGRKGLAGAPWQIARLLNQAGFFTLKKLVNIYKKLLKIDTDIKTGQTFMPLDWHLDLLIANL